MTWQSYLHLPRVEVLENIIVHQCNLGSCLRGEKKKKKKKKKKKNPGKKKHIKKNKTPKKKKEKKTNKYKKKKKKKKTKTIYINKITHTN
eukprot:NODE_14454_length_1108_cov_5.531091.p5 GENE.NODE_14454_length_1108_cov_5.531091~~NODE_14454_length_1108_cov_5.531091.p5  ORF type:complete len:90 (+),score=54.48 NODE_14454_length_1108_cov_5.531091:827-1096(+)